MSSMMNDEPITLKKTYNVEISKYRNRVKTSVTSVQTFTDDKLPGVNFVMIYHIRDFGHDQYSLDLISLKTPSQVARWAISIQEGNHGCCDNQTSNWNNILKLKIEPLFPSTFYGSIVTFEIEITWYGFMKELPTSNLYHNMKCFHASSTLSDFAICIDNEEIPVHKVIFAAQSPVFLAMFETDMMESKENKIIIKDTKIDIMKKVIEFLYTGGIDAEMDIDVLFAILSVAIKYQIINLKYYCIAIVSQKLDVSNVLQVVDESCFYTIPELIKNATDFTIKNKVKIMRLEDLGGSLTRNPAYWSECLRRLTE